MRTSRVWGTILVAHLVVNLVHGYPHAQLGIGLEAWQWAFVLGVITIGPFLSLPFLGHHPRTGAALLATTMTASLIFGLYYHFVAAGPDHVANLPAEGLGMAFVATAVALVPLEALGVVLGLYVLARTPPTNVTRRRRASGPSPTEEETVR